MCNTAMANAHTYTYICVRGWWISGQVGEFDLFLDPFANNFPSPAKIHKSPL